MEDLKRVHGKTAILFRMAEAVVENPEGTIKDVLYPVAGEQTLKDLVREFKATGSAYEKEVHSTIRSSYGNRYCEPFWMQQMSADTPSVHPIRGPEIRA